MSRPRRRLSVRPAHWPPSSRKLALRVTPSARDLPIPRSFPGLSPLSRPRLAAGRTTRAQHLRSSILRGVSSIQQKSRMLSSGCAWKKAAPSPARPSPLQGEKYDTENGRAHVRTQVNNEQIVRHLL